MSPSERAGERTSAETAIWQQLEFGSHRADLALWEELAAEADGPVLELGAGAGRVALHLARRGHGVVAVERVPELADELERAARELELEIAVVRADLAELDRSELPIPVAAALAPLHVVQQLDPEARRSLLAALAALLPRGARVGAVVVDESSLVGTGHEPRPVPDMREIEGWVYSSEPLWLQMDEQTIRVRRLRERVSPQGEIERTVHDDLLHRLAPAALEGEAANSGLSSVERRPIAATTYEADSIAVILERR